MPTTEIFDTPTATTKPPKLWSFTFVKIGLACLLLNIGISMVFSAFPLYLGAKGLSSGAIGTISSLYTMSAMLMRFFAGNLVDRKGRRTIGLLGVILFTLPVLGYMWAPAIGFIIICRMVQGFGSSAGTICTGTMAADVLPPERFAEGIGYYGLFVSAAGAIAPALAIAIITAQPDGSTLFPRVLAISAATAVLLAAINYEKSSQTLLAARQQATQKPEKDGSAFFLWNFFEKDAMPAALVACFVAIGNSAVVLFLSPFGISLGLKNVGLFFTVQAGCMFLTRLISGPLSKRVGILKALWLGLALMGTGFAILSRLNSMAVLLVAATFVGLGGGLSFPLLNVMAVQKAPPSRRGKATSTYYAAFDIGLGIGGLIWGFMADFAGGYRLLYIGGAAVFVVNIIIAGILFGKKNSDSPE